MLTVHDLQLPLLPTTTVGSFPKPEYLLQARKDFKKSNITREQLTELEKQATREIIQFQEELGLDVLVDGEMYRGDMVAYFAEEIGGFAQSGLVRSYGNRYYHKPIVTDKLERKQPITVAWWKYAQSLSTKPIKGMLTGPYTIMDWSFNEYYPDRRELTLALAHIIHDEVKDLEQAGAKIIQVDEPAISVRFDELDLAKEALEIVTKDVNAYIISHICFGEFSKVYDQMITLPVQQLDLEVSNSSFDLVERMKQKAFPLDIGLGVFDVHDRRVESVDYMKKIIQQALTVLSPEKIWVSPDCGLKTRALPETREKLAHLVQAAQELRATLT